MEQIIRSRRKTLGLQVRPDGTLVIRAPLHMSQSEIRAAVTRHEAWIARTRAHLAAAAPAPGSQLTPEALSALAQQAMEELPPLTAQWASRLGVSYGRITIRNQRTKWGSCSAAGNLNFNCLLMLCPPEVRAYIVVHELCHRKQMNHSPAFWAEVERAMPDYRRQEAWLKANGAGILRRMTG